MMIAVYDGACLCLQCMTLWCDDGQVELVSRCLFPSQQQAGMVRLHQYRSLYPSLALLPGYFRQGTWTRTGPSGAFLTGYFSPESFSELEFLRKM